MMLLSLPDWTLIYIASYLQRDDIVRLALVSSRLFHLMRSIEYYGPPKFRYGIFHRLLITPLLSPIMQHPWEAHSVYNPAVVYLNEEFHLLYRARTGKKISSIGYATSTSDATQIKERLNTPIFEPKESFEKNPGDGFFGCEDPRITKIDDRLYMIYTAFDGKTAKTALTSIHISDFLAKKWNWSKRVVLSNSNENHKNWVLFPERIAGRYAILTSLTPRLSIVYLDSLAFANSPQISTVYYKQQRDSWDTWVRGVAAPPIKLAQGWLIFYHSMNPNEPFVYKLGAMLLNLDDPTQILYRSKEPLLRPIPFEIKEFESLRLARIIYVCGAVLKEDKIYIFYGVEDNNIYSAYIELDELLVNLGIKSECISNRISKNE